MNRFEKAEQLRSQTLGKTAGEEGGGEKTGKDAGLGSETGKGDGDNRLEAGKGAGEGNSPAGKAPGVDEGEIIIDGNADATGDFGIILPKAILKKHKKESKIRGRNKSFYLNFDTIEGIEKLSKKLNKTDSQLVQEIMQSVIDKYLKK